MNSIWRIAFSIASLCYAAQAFSESYTVPEYQAPAVQSLQATTLREFSAAEADQGVAVDKAFFYAVDNTVIGKYRRENGEFVERWIGPKHGLIRHMNSCYADSTKLWCANSNYSQVPMASSIEIFSTKTLEHLDSHSLGITDEGSLVWFDGITLKNKQRGFIAGFAHYSKKGGLPHKGNPYSATVLFDEQWRRLGGWAYPQSILERMHPYSASGGAVSPQGLLYVMGHDLPEMYVLAKPSMGPTLLHLATISIEAEGQAFAFDPTHDDQVWVIDRRAKKVRVIKLPPPPALPENARRF